MGRSARERLRADGRRSRPDETDHRRVAPGPTDRASQIALRFCEFRVADSLGLVVVLRTRTTGHLRRPLGALHPFRWIAPLEWRNSIVSKTLLFGIGVTVFAATVVGAMIYGRFLFDRFYQAQVGSASAAAAIGALAASTAAAAAAVLGSDSLTSLPPR